MAEQNLPRSWRNDEIVHYDVLYFWQKLFIFESKFSYKICLFKEGIKKNNLEECLSTNSQTPSRRSKMLCYAQFIYLFIVFQLISILPSTRFKKFQLHVPVCKTGMMSLLQSSPVQHSTAHSSWVKLCLLSPLRKPPTAAQAAFLSVIIGQKRKKKK